MTLYLNEKALADPTCDYFVQRAAYQQLCAQLGRITPGRGGSVEDPFLGAYLVRQPLPPSVEATIERGFCPNARYGMCMEMLAAAERHVTGMFEDRVAQHIACDLERRMWGQRDRPGFDKFVKRVAKVVLQAAAKNADAAATARVH